MKKKLYVGNLSYSLTEDVLKEAFESKGKQVASVQIIQDKYTNRSRGFGFVELGENEDAQGAIDIMNGVEVDGRPLKVSEAQERSQTPRRSFGNEGGAGRGGFGRGSRDGGGYGGGGEGRGGKRSSRW